MIKGQVIDYIVYEDYKMNNPDKPASKKQLFALYIASKKAGEKHDYREDNLTMGQAAELLSKFREKTGYEGKKTTKTGNKSSEEKEEPKAKLKKEWLEYFEKNMLKEVVAKFKKIIDQVSVVEDDPEFNPDPKKRKKFLFRGMGCGIALFQYGNNYNNKGTKKAREIDDIIHATKMKECLDMILKNFDKKIIKQMENEGTPIPALWMQDGELARTYMSCGVTFMKEHGIKNVTLRYLDD
jgi:hypothetical protein